MVCWVRIAKWPMVAGLQGSLGQGKHDDIGLSGRRTFKVMTCDVLYPQKE